MPLRSRGALLPGWGWALLAAVLLAAALASRSPDAIDPGPGVLAPHAPVQQPVDDAPPARIGEFRITALARFEVDARVLAREDYRFDAEARLSPMDLALGWGRMSDSAVLDRLDIRQRGRFYHYRWGAEGPPIPANEIVRSSANMHMVPVDDEVADALERVVPGQLIRFEGWLIRAERHDGWQWVSSTTRSDSGDGACELVLVHTVSAQ